MLIDRFDAVVSGNVERDIPARGSEAVAELAIIGSRHSFSECLVRATSMEVGDSGLERLETLADFDALPPVRKAAVRLVVVDEATISQDDGATFGERGGFGSAVVVLAYRSEEAARRIIDLASGFDWIESYLPIDIRFDLWISVLRLLLSGGRYVPAELLRAEEPAEAVANDRIGTAARSGAASDAGLTPREKQVLTLLAKGLPNKLIASKLDLSQHTIKLHIHHVITKLGVQNRTEAVARYFGQR
ncbi:response regulator transcription factor [Defluviimonas sp. WL0024]|uniref:Response regulator transcription factor n=1 Tax=Albidovulum salinarum TaxID=2984153 RepID=A0ABT2WY82_9RHOB|nr:response regulator transcription factor [Defluviimonas sp. WL0024]MCU9846636.1 response regulator transcription factor [Defluviimonas sp. WL0024]